MAALRCEERSTDPKAHVYTPPLPTLVSDSLQNGSELFGQSSHCAHRRGETSCQHSHAPSLGAAHVQWLRKAQELFQWIHRFGAHTDLSPSIRPEVNAPECSTPHSSWCYHGTKKQPAMEPSRALPGHLPVFFPSPFKQASPNAQTDAFLFLQFHTTMSPIVLYSKLRFPLESGVALPRSKGSSAVCDETRSGA